MSAGKPESAAPGKATLTKDQILGIPAGLEMDVLVAVALGLRLDYEFAEMHAGRPCVPALRDQYDEWGLLPHYSENIEDAWTIIERHSFNIVPCASGMDGKPAGYWVGLCVVDWRTGATIHEVLDVGNPSSCFGVTAPLAIFRAALAKASPDSEQPGCTGRQR